MNVVVNDVPKSKGFIFFLKKKILKHAALIINIPKLDAYNNYFKLLYNIDISAKKVVLLSLSTLQHDYQEGAFLNIFIDPNIKYPDTDIELITLCKIINNGALGVPAYPIFTDTFNHIKNNIKTYIKKFSLGMGWW